MIRQITFGPFLSRYSGEVIHASDLETTGFAFEFASSTEGARIPIYRRIQDRQPGKSDFHDYLIHERDIPFEISYIPYLSVKTAQGLFVALENLLVTLYTDFETARPLMDFLTELRENLPLHCMTRPGAVQRGMGLSPELVSAGFDMVSTFAYGRSVTVSLAWISPQDRGGAGTFHFPSGCLDFRPQPDQTLDKGKWVEPMDGSLNLVLKRLLQKSHPQTPLELLSEEGKKIVLAAFVWTPLALMTTQQARQARIEFVRKHPELMEKPRDLAKMMRDAKLYSEITALGQIVKSLNSIISASRAEK